VIGNKDVACYYHWYLYEFIPLKSTNKVNIVRYIKPDFAIANSVEGEKTGYDVPDFTGVTLHYTK
jgi:hypothetical protein